MSVLFIIFYFTFFSFGKFLSEILSRFINNQFANFVLGVVKSITKSEIIYDFFESGIVGGIGSVFSFLPQVVILFLCLGIMEDSGYLSRVAFSLDDIFSKVGLSGKSVYTLLMGFGCSTSACMTARVMEDRNSKIKTAMLAPYMSCSAKLPIYAVLGSAFFGASNVFVIFAMYMVGVLVALVLSVFYEKRLAELAITSGKQFLFRVGSVLISVNIIIWVLTSFSFGFSFVKISGEASMLEVLGGIIAPIFSPLGFGSWGATSALLAGLIAKEVIVSTIAMVNGVNSSSENYIQSVSKSLTMPNSAVCFNPASALSYMVFCLLYSPCIATISVLKKEVGKKWLIVSVFVQFIIAYLISLIVYSSVSLILSKGILMFLLIFMVFILVLFALFSLIKRFSKRNSCHLCGKCKRS